MITHICAKCDKVSELPFSFASSYGKFCSESCERNYLDELQKGESQLLQSLLDQVSRTFIEKGAEAAQMARLLGQAAVDGGLVRRDIFFQLVNAKTVDAFTQFTVGKVMDLKLRAAGRLAGKNGRASDLPDWLDVSSSASPQFLEHRVYQNIIVHIFRDHALAFGCYQLNPEFRAECEAKTVALGYRYEDFLAANEAALRVGEFESAAMAAQIYAERNQKEMQRQRPMRPLYPV